MKKTTFFLSAILFSILMQAAVVTSTTDTYQLTLTDVTAPAGCTINEAKTELTGWPSQTDLRWTVNVKRTGRYLVKATIASDWEGSLLKVTMGSTTFTSKSCVTKAWGPLTENCYVGMLDITTTGEQDFVVNNENGNFNVGDFTLEPADDILELTPTKAVASSDGVQVHADYIDFWNDAATYLTYTVQVPKAGYYKFCGTFATDVALKAGLTFTSGAESANYEVQGNKNWTFFFEQSTTEIRLAGGEQQIVLTRSGAEGYGPVNLTTLYFTLVEEAASISSNTGSTAELSGRWKNDDIVNQLVTDLGGASTAANMTTLDATNATFTTGTWNAPASLNPNCLMHISSASNLTGTNIVKENQCAQLSLSDQQPFQSANSITVSLGSFTRSVNSGGWYTLCLPYPLSAAQMATAGIQTAERFLNVDLEAQVVNFETVSNMEANTAYIVLFNGTGDHELFPQVETIVSTASRGTVFKGVYTATDVSGKYALNADGTAFIKAKAGSTLSPFRAYLDIINVPDMAPIRHGDGIITGIEAITSSTQIIGGKGCITIFSDAPQKLRLYTVLGQLIIEREILAGQTVLSSLTKGVYILNNQKVAVY